jgi:hypothetical protein
MLTAATEFGSTSSTLGFSGAKWRTRVFGIGGRRLERKLRRRGKAAPATVLATRRTIVWLR